MRGRSQLGGSQTVNKPIAPDPCSITGDVPFTALLRLSNEDAVDTHSEWLQAGRYSQNHRVIHPSNAKQIRPD